MLACSGLHVETNAAQPELEYALSGPAESLSVSVFSWSWLWNKITPYQCTHLHYSRRRGNLHRTNTCSRYIYRAHCSRWNRQNRPPTRLSMQTYSIFVRRLGLYKHFLYQTPCKKGDLVASTCHESKTQENWWNCAYWVKYLPYNALKYLISCWIIL